MPGLETLIVRSKIDWDILVLTECWIKENPNLPHLKGYNSFSTTKNCTQNEGVVVYTKTNIPVLVEEPQFPEGNCLVLKLAPDICIIAIYRSPAFKNITTFLNSLNNILMKYSNNKTVILTGDLNINITGENLEKDANDYLNMTAYHGLLPAHTIPTRLQSCLDHVLLKTKDQAYTYVAQTTLTDHYTVLFLLKLKSNISHTTHSNYQIIDYNGFVESFKNIDLRPIFATNDVNFATDFLVSSVKIAIETNTKTFTTSKRKRIIKPWITPGLLRCIRNRDNLHKKAKKHPDNETISTTYKRYRNYCNNLLKKLKNMHEKNELIKAKQNSKQLWTSINNISNRKPAKTIAKELITDKTDPKNAVNKVNEFFVNIGKKLSQNIRSKVNVPISTNSSTTNNYNSLVLLPTDENEVKRLIMSLKSDAMGWDNINAKLLKLCIDTVAPALVHICNLALDTGKFPLAFKKSVITPIYKNGARDQVNNYRPISILPAMSKILEKIMNSQLSKYLEINKLLSSSQYGFRSGVSTADAVNKLTDYIFQNLDKNMKCIAVFLDLAKAFDTVCIPLLINKLEKIGVRGEQLELFSDYLTNRTQQVKIGEVVSDELPVSHGVPQGSILGPTLFLVYINELCQLKIPNGSVITFADDTALVFKADSWEEVYKQAQLGLDAVKKWLDDNFLTLNVDKTKYVAFTKRGSPPNYLFNIVAHSCAKVIQSTTCNCASIQNVNVIKYLGIQIDYKLSFDSHIEMLTSRLRKLMYVFKSIRRVADFDIIKIIYTALCQSLLTYCVLVWGGTYKTTLLKLERAQRAVLKTALSLPYRTPTTELYKLCKLLSVRQLYILHAVTKKHSLLPYDPSILTKRRKDIVCKSTHQTHFSHRSFAFLGSYLYNKINKILDIYPLNKQSSKIIVSKWLATLNYEQTEQLLEVDC